MKQDRGNTITQQSVSLEEIRNEAARLSAELAWPGPSDEFWRRTDISGVDFESYSSNGGAPEFLSEIPHALRPEVYSRSLTTGIGDSTASLLNRRIAAARDRVETFHFSRLNSGFSLEIPAGHIEEEPLMIRFTGAAGGHEAAFAHIRAGRGSSVNLFFILEDQEGAESLRTAGFHFELDEGSSVRAAVLQDLGRESRYFAFHSADVAADASFSFAEIDLGSRMSVSAPVFSTRGAGADINITGLYAVAAGQHKNMRPVQHHAAPHGTSNSLYKGALLPGGRTVFQGLIRVEPGAIKTDAYLSNKNLLMADGARADSIPSLQILNNDVRCTHGSTTGKLNPEQVFYLQSRGFSRLEAERMLLRGFYQEALGKLPAVAAEIVQERLEAHSLFRDS